MCGHGRRAHIATQLGGEQPTPRVEFEASAGRRETGFRTLRLPAGGLFSRPTFRASGTDGRDFADLKRRGRRPATIARKLAAIAVYHRSMDHPTPTAHDVVRAVVRGTRRQLGVAKPQ
jgi:hypothetical protein